MADLTTVALVKAHQDIDGDADDALIGTMIADATDMIEQECKRRFSSASETKKYDAGEPHVFGRTLYFGEDVLSVDAVIDASGTLSSDKYRLLPTNETPKYALELKRGYGWTYSEPEEAITVVATTGYCATGEHPNAIRRAATELAQWLYLTRDNTGDTVRFADGEINIPADAPQSVVRILHRGRFVKDRLYS